MFYIKKYFFKFFSAVIFIISFTAIHTNAQSNDQNFPTPITSNQIDGIIKARPIGDSRLTTYYFTFNGNQGDIFINVVTNNFNGDIDIFTVDGLRPLTKIVVYADSSDNETGRVIYLRKPEKILMRIQGRTPNDDPATFRFKFAGSFVASADTETEQPKLPEIRREKESGIIVNEVGTIIGVKPKPTPEPKEIAVEKPAEKEVTEKEETVAEDTEEKNEPEKTEKPQVVVTDELEKSKPEETVAKTEEDKTETVETPGENNEVKPTEETAEKEKPKKARKEKPKKVTETSALENIRLVVLLKDGGKIERPMSEVLKFGVEKGILTIISKDGSISRYSILDVESVTIK